MSHLTTLERTLFLVLAIIGGYALAYTAPLFLTDTADLGNVVALVVVMAAIGVLDRIWTAGSLRAAR